MTNKFAPFKKLSSYYGFAGHYTKQDYRTVLNAPIIKGYKVASETRLKAIIDANRTVVKSHGMVGALEMFANMVSVERLKENAADAILQHRAAVTANRRQGRVVKHTQWLEKAAHYRKEALRRQLIEAAA